MICQSSHSLTLLLYSLHNKLTTLILRFQTLYIIITSANRYKHFQLKCGTPTDLHRNSHRAFLCSILFMVSLSFSFIFMGACASSRFVARETKRIVIYAHLTIVWSYRIIPSHEWKTTWKYQLRRRGEWQSNQIIKTRIMTSIHILRLFKFKFRYFLFVKHTNCTLTTVNDATYIGIVKLKLVNILCDWNW